MNDAFTDRKPESAALLERIEFDEATENFVVVFRRDAASRVADVKIEEVPFVGPVAEPDASCRGEFHRIVQEVVDNLHDPLTIRANGAFGQALFETDLHLVVLLSHPGALFYLVQHAVEVYFRVRKFERTRFDFRQVEDVTDQLQ